VAEEDRKAELLGIGLDNQDGHVRITRGRNFHILGGSHDTHQTMQEQCVKFNEKLEIKGKQLVDLEQREFLDIAAECRMNIALPGRKKNEKPPCQDEGS